MNETQAWHLFASSGKIQDYLNFKNIQQNNAKETIKSTDREYENFHNGTGTQTTEYR